MQKTVKVTQQKHVMIEEVVRQTSVQAVQQIDVPVPQPFVQRVVMPSPVPQVMIDEMVTLPTVEQCEYDSNKARVESVQSSSSEQDASTTKAIEIREQQQEQRQTQGDRQKKQSIREMQSSRGRPKQRRKEKRLLRM